MDRINQIKKWVIEQVIWAEKNLKGKSGTAKRVAVVKKLDDMISLPTYLEWVDDIILGKLVDMACERLNKMTDHNFESLKLDAEQEQAIADEIENPKEF